MRSLLAAIAVVAIAVGCASPVPSPASSAASVSPDATTTDGSPPVATMTPFSAPYPTTGWAVAASIDATGDGTRIVSNGRVKEGAYVDVVFTCEQTTRIAGTVGVGGAGTVPFRFEATCSPGDTGRVTLDWTGRTAPLTLDASADPEVRFWVKVGVPREDLLD